MKELLANGLKISRPRSLGITLLAILSLSSFSGCQSPSTLRPEEMTPPKEVTLAPGDVVRYSFIGAPELSGAQKIRADGKMTMPMIGEIEASGKELLPLQSELERRYKSQLKSSDMVLSLESGGTQIYLSGAVKTPGRINLDKPLTVFEAIMEAGGFVDFSDPGHVRVIHLNKGQHKADVINLKPALKGERTRAYYVTAGDVIYVPTKLLNF
jgi:polysaccharide export outer membrane protein